MSYPPGYEGSGTPPELPPTYVPPAYPPPPAPPAPTSAVPSQSGPAYPPAPYSAPPVQYGGGLPPTQPAPPTYDPTLAPVPYSAPPMSGPYGYGAPMPVPPAKKSPVAAIFIALTVVFLLAAGGLGALFVKKQDEAKKLTTNVSQLESDLAGAQKKLDTAEKARKTAEDDLDDMNTERDAIADCLNAIYDWWDALDGTAQKDTPATEELRLKAVKLCNVADKYL